MRCILLWSAVVLVMLNLSYNSFDRPIVFVSTLFICLTLFGVSLLLSHVRHPKRTVLAGAVLIVLMGLGAVIGAGVVTYSGIAVGLTGRSAWIAYAVAILLGFLCNLPLILMTTAARIKGGNYSLMK